MHLARILSIAGLATLMIGCASNNHRPVQLTVMTYNIHHGAGMDGKLDLSRLAAVIEAARPDLVALQELDHVAHRTGGIDETAELGKLTGMHALFGRAMDFEGGQYGDAILSRFPIASSRIIALPYTVQREHEPRVALLIRCQTPGGEIVFLSTHLDQNGEPSDRLPQTKALLAGLVDEKSPAILAGDFNCRPESTPIALVEETWLRASDDQPSDPSIQPRSKIDHIFVAPEARWRVIDTHVIANTMASDHRPVVATLELLPTK